MDGIPPALARLALRPAYLWLVTAGIAPSVLGAQEPPRQAVDDQHEAYEIAQQQYRTARDVWTLTDRAWTSLIEQHDRAREREDEAETIRLRAEIQAKTKERTSAERALVRSKEEWYDAADVLIQRIDSYLELLTQQLDNPPVGSQDALLLEVNEMEALRAAVVADTPREPIELPSMPDIRALPEDGPTQLTHKAGIYEDIARKIERLLAEVDDEIKKLMQEQRQDEWRQGYERRREGFDRGTVPVQGGAGSTRVAGDTTVVDLTLTREQRIEDLQELHEELSQQRGVALERAQRLRALAGGAG